MSKLRPKPLAKPSRYRSIEAWAREVSGIESQRAERYVNGNQRIPIDLDIKLHAAIDQMTLAIHRKDDKRRARK